MDRQEAKAVAEDVLAGLRASTYEELSPLASKSRWVNAQGASGAWYGVKIEALWDEGGEGGWLQVWTSAMNGDRGRFGFWWQSEEAGFTINPDGHIDD